MLNHIPYDDENLGHVTNGPDYGQPWHNSCGWEETDSKEYPDFVFQIKKQILKNRIKLISE